MCCDTLSPITDLLWSEFHSKLTLYLFSILKVDHRHIACSLRCNGWAFIYDKGCRLFQPLSTISSLLSSVTSRRSCIYIHTHCVSFVSPRTTKKGVSLFSIAKIIFGYGGSQLYDYPSVSQHLCGQCIPQECQYPQHVQCLPYLLAISCNA